MKHNEKKSARKVCTAQFYKKNRGAFLIALATTFLNASLNLWIAWVLQQMIDRVSGVANALTLPVLAGNMVGIVLAILALKAVKYAAYPRFMQRAMTQYKNSPFRS